MKSSLPRTLLAGLAGTAVMTMIMAVAPLMGLPRMNAAEMLSRMTGTPIAAGWLMHVMIGLIFAIAYSTLFLTFVRLHQNLLRGTLFGVAVFIVAQIVMAMMNGIMGSAPAMQGSMALMMIGSLIGHIMYGIPVALVARSEH